MASVTITEIKPSNESYDILDELLGNTDYATDDHANGQQDAPPTIRTFTYTNKLRRTILYDFLSMRAEVEMNIKPWAPGCLCASYPWSLLDELRRDLKEMEGTRKEHTEDWKERVIETYDYLLFWKTTDNLDREIYELEEFLSELPYEKRHVNFVLEDSAIIYER